MIKNTEELDRFMRKTYLYISTIMILSLTLLAIISADKDQEPAFVTEKRISFDENTNVEVSRIEYKSGELLVSGYKVTPELVENRKYPVLIFNRGGNRYYGAISNDFAEGYLSKFAEEGYVVLASQYRGVYQEGQEEYGGADVEDVHNLVETAYKLDYADTDKIYMFGISRGSIMSFIAVKERNDIKAIATLGGITDLTSFYNERELQMKSVLELLIGGSPEESPEEYERRSVLQWADELDTPVMLLHGTKDESVNMMHSVNLAQELRRLEKDYNLITYGNGDHGLREFKEEYIREILKWFSEH